MQNNLGAHLEQNGIVISKKVVFEESESSQINVASREKYFRIT